MPLRLFRDETRQWMGVALDDKLEHALSELRAPSASNYNAPPGLRAELRPYQQVGVQLVADGDAIRIGSMFSG